MPHPGRLTRRKEIRYPLYRRRVCPMAGFGRVRKILLSPEICFCSVCVLSLCFVFLIVVHFAFCPLLYNRHKTNIHAPSEIFLMFFSFLLSVFLCPHCPGFCLLSLLCVTHNTNIHAPAGIRNPQSQQAVGRRFSPYTVWPLGSAGFDPQTVQPVASPGTRSDNRTDK
jgi:hypothetical protein